ncbi:MAG: S1C family serine protease [Ilumatobacteraceae bacterium]
MTNMFPPPSPWESQTPQSEAQQSYTDQPYPQQLLESSPYPVASRPRFPARFVVGVSLLALAMGAIGGVVVQQVLERSGSTTYSPRSAAPLSVVDDDGRDDDDKSDVAAVAERLASSVVTISSDVQSGLATGGATGTGVVLTADGEILTNAHVVEGASEVRVRFAGETEPVVARILASDEGNDLALLKVDARGLTPATFADPNSLRVGDEVVAIGYALALDGGPSVTVGIISALKRTIVTSSGALNSLIQTDAAISSGNSGGPLSNMRGEVVGINTAVARGGTNSAANNIGFAISVGEVLTVVEQLRATAGGQPRVEGFLGVGLAERTDGGAGAIIADVQPDSPAAAAGIREGDLVLSVDGEPINGQTGLVAAIRDRSPGDVVEIEVSRNGVRETLTATLVARANQ